VRDGLRHPAAIEDLLALFAGLLGVQDVKGEANPGGHATLRALGRTFVVVRCDGGLGAIAHAARRAAEAAGDEKKPTLPIVVVPFMAEAGQRACADVGTGWADWSGNASIVAPGLRVLIRGLPNRFRRPGRPATIFAPKSARLVRWLLVHPEAQVSQRDLARATGVNEGLVSRVTSRLDAEQFIERGEGGRIRLVRPGLLLDAWREAYRFDAQTVVRGHLAARSGDARSRLVADALREAGVAHAATGLSAAWQLTHFAGFRLATFFVGAGAVHALTPLGFREGERDANLWLLQPNDEGVFQGASDREGVRCVHPVQVVLDLAGHPERAREAAERVRLQHLEW
jgi:hypothetical protein